MWNDNKFCLQYTILLKEKSLDLKVNVKNKNESQDFDLTFCFHTYFTTSDLSLVAIDNMKELNYTDKTLENWPQVKEENEIVNIKGFTDRVYAQGTFINHVDTISGFLFQLFDLSIQLLAIVLTNFDHFLATLYKF